MQRSERERERGRRDGKIKKRADRQDGSYSNRSELANLRVRECKRNSVVEITATDR